MNKEASDDYSRVDDEQYMGGTCPFSDDGPKEIECEDGDCDKAVADAQE